MGVLPCSRVGCTNVMCDRLSQKWGYICDDCFEEMVLTRVIDIGAFLETPRKEKVLDQEAYEKMFPLRSDQ